MKPFQLLQEISEKTMPGRSPAFTPAIILKALELVEIKQGIGRKLLSRELRMGEGSVRTLINRMKEKSLIETSRGGMILLDKGRIFIEKIREHMIGMEIPDTKITLGPVNYAILVKDSSNRVEKGIEQRDSAIIAGAKGATTLVFTGEKLIMPTMDINIEVKTEELLISKLRPCKDDVIIIVTDSDPFISEIGAKSAALDLLFKSV